MITEYLPRGKFHHQGQIRLDEDQTRQIFQEKDHQDKVVEGVDPSRGPRLLTVTESPDKENGGGEDDQAGDKEVKASFAPGIGIIEHAVEPLRPTCLDTLR